MLVRVARPEDAERVERVLKASFPTLMADAYDAVLLASVLPLITRAHPRLLASGTYYVAESEDAILGCGGWSRERPGTTETESGIAHIRHFATHPDWAGKGVGRALYQRCEVEARAAGIHVFDVYSSLNGERFYAAVGFARIGSIEVEMGEALKFPSILMRRSI